MQKQTTLTRQLSSAIRFVNPVNRLFLRLLCCTVLATLMLQPLLAATNPAAIAAFEQDDLGNAKNLFEKALQDNQSDFVALQYLGKIALREGELDAAEEYIEKALELAPLNAEIVFDNAEIMGSQAQDAGIFSAPGYAKNLSKPIRKR